MKILGAQILEREKPLAGEHEPGSRARTVKGSLRCLTSSLSIAAQFHSSEQVPSDSAVTRMCCDLLKIYLFKQHSQKPALVVLWSGNQAR